MEADSESALAKELCCPVRAVLAAGARSTTVRAVSGEKRKPAAPDEGSSGLVTHAGGRDGPVGGAGAGGLTLWEGRLGYKSEKVSLLHLG